MVASSSELAWREKGEQSSPFCLKTEKVVQVNFNISAFLDPRDLPKPEFHRPGYELF